MIDFVFMIFFFLEPSSWLIVFLSIFLVLSGSTRKFAVFILKHPFSLRVSELIGKLTWGLGISVSGAAIYTDPTLGVIGNNIFILGAFMMALGVVIEEFSIMTREKEKKKEKK